VVMEILGVDAIRELDAASGMLLMKFAEKGN
jgi:hypothetical protein